MKKTSNVGVVMKKSAGLTVITTALILGGCATPPDKIEAAYVSPITYQEYTCDQIGQEAARVSDRAAQSLGVQQKKAQNDAVKVGVGIVLFWPALLFVDGKGANETEVARLKGQMDALEQVSIQKNCGIQFQRPEPPKNTNQAADLTVKDS
jgi:hypothetical protein